MMSSDNRVQLTPPAEERLASILESYRNEILDVLRLEKFVPGEEFTEANAADVDTAARRVRQGKTRRVEMRRIYSQMMLAIGGLLALAGILYPSFRESLSNPTQLILIVAGLYTGFAGFFLSRMMAFRYSRESEDNPDMSEKLAHLERMVRELKKSTTKSDS